MDYRHISVKLIDGVTVVQFLDLASAVHSEAAIHEIGSGLRSLTDDAQPCSLVLDFENKEFFPNDVFE